MVFSAKRGRLSLTLSAFESDIWFSWCARFFATCEFFFVFQQQCASSLKSRSRLFEMADTCTHVHLTIPKFGRNAAVGPQDESLLWVEWHIALGKAPSIAQLTCGARACVTFWAFIFIWDRIYVYFLACYKERSILLRQIMQFFMFLIYFTGNTLIVCISGIVGSVTRLDCWIQVPTRQEFEIRSVFVIATIRITLTTEQRIDIQGHRRL